MISKLDQKTFGFEGWALEMNSKLSQAETKKNTHTPYFPLAQTYFRRWLETEKNTHNTQSLNHRNISRNKS